MSQLADIESAQKSLEECFMKRMGELEAQIQSNVGGPVRDTVAKVAEEFRTFRELMFNMLGLLRKQISDCTKALDNMETRHRRKALIFTGVPEAESENCASTILEIISRKLSLTQCSASSIKTCHRLGPPKKDGHRPILVRFTDLELKSTVWRSKTKLRGSSVTIKEFLTKSRQLVFSSARIHFGLRGCWTQDGVIVVKTPDGLRTKITTMDELNPLMAKHPKATMDVPSSGRSGVKEVGSSGIDNRNTGRRN